MGVYQRWFVPRLIHLAMRRRDLVDYRRRALASAAGRVLEIGIGSGLNLPLYGPAVDEVIGIDPSPELLRRARRAMAPAGLKVALIEGSAERLPLDSASVDAVTMTWTLCSIPDPARALREIRRVLRPGGRLSFVEHGRAPEPNVARWQDRLTPLWQRIAGGCHLNRPVDQLFQDAGFRIERMATGYFPGPRVLAFMYEGAGGPA